VASPSIRNTTKEEEEEDYLLLNKPLVLLVCPVPIAVFLLRYKLFRQLFKDDLEELLLARLVVCISVPDCNLDGIPAYGVGDTADVVVECL
jgi:hypothetical protein